MPNSGTLSVVAGLAGAQGYTDSVGTNARFQRQYGIGVYDSGSKALATQNEAGCTIRCIDLSTQAVTTLAGSGTCGNAQTDGIGTSAVFGLPSFLAVHPTGFALVLDTRPSQLVRRFDLSSYAVTTMAGDASGYADGVGTSAKFQSLFGVAITPQATAAVIVEHGAHRVRSIDLSTSAVTTLAGSSSSGYTDSTGTSARFYYPAAVVISPDGLMAYIADYYNHKWAH